MWKYQAQYSELCHAPQGFGIWLNAHGYSVRTWTIFLQRNAPNTYLVFGGTSIFFLLRFPLCQIPMSTPSIKSPWIQNKVPRTFTAVYTEYDTVMIWERHGTPCNQQQLQCPRSCLREKKRRRCGGLSCRNNAWIKCWRRNGTLAEHGTANRRKESRQDFDQTRSADGW